MNVTTNSFPTQASGEPKAYLQIIYFDKDYKYVDSKITALSPQPQGQQKQTEASLKMRFYRKDSSFVKELSAPLSEQG